MKEDAKFEKGHKPRMEVRKWPSAGAPTVLNFPPQAYRNVRADEVEAFTRDLKKRFGLVSDIGGASGGTVSFCTRGETGAAYRCDSDMDSTARFSDDRRDIIRDWHTNPTVLNFEPEAYAMVSPEELDHWLIEIKGRLGLELNADVGPQATTSFCTEGNGSSGYACDCDFSTYPG